MIINTTVIPYIPKRIQSGSSTNPQPQVITLNTLQTIKKTKRIQHTSPGNEKLMFTVILEVLPPVVFTPIFNPDNDSAK